MLENEFGTSNEDDCLIKILENGEFQSSAVCSVTPLLLSCWLPNNTIYRPAKGTVIPISATDLLV